MEVNKTCDREEQQPEDESQKKLHACRYLASGPVCGPRFQTKRVRKRLNLNKESRLVADAQAFLSPEISGGARGKGHAAAEML